MNVSIRGKQLSRLQLVLKNFRLIFVFHSVSSVVTSFRQSPSLFRIQSVA